MNRHRTIAAVTAAFGQIVDAAASSAIADATVHFARPDTAGSEPKVYLFMYQIGPNAAARNLDLPARYGDGIARQRPLVALDLHYLLTFTGDEKKLQPQQMLGSVVSSIHARPILSPEEIRNARSSTLEPPLIGDDDEVPIAPVRFAPVGLNLEELSKVWSVFFQTPYGLSAVYRASVVLVEADISIRPPLPAQRTRGRGELLANPVIAQVTSTDGAYQPIRADSTLVIAGKRLSGEKTLVRFPSVDVEPDTRSEDRVTLAVPPAAQVVGMQSLRIVHRPWNAAPDDGTDEVESNLASFVLHPTVSAIALDGTTLQIDVVPAIGQGQKAEALLDQIEVEEPASYRLRRLDFTGESTTTLRFDTSGVAAGTYAVRVRVDGAISRIEVDEATDTLIHQVTL